MADLSLATFKDIVDELEKRFTAGVIAVTNDQYQRRACEWKLEGWGNILTQWGLAAAIEGDVEARYRDTAEDDPEE